MVGTPIGNLKDLTLRAIDTLRAADRIYAEDTRRTRALLSHLGITGKPLERFDAHAEASGVEALLARVESGEHVALVSDAGMPLISDPGARLMNELHVRALPFQIVPGPSAVTTAVAASGLVAGPFTFLGFLPRSGEKRQRALQRIASSSEPVLLFESPGRTQATLRDLAELVPGRPAAVCRELTKLHEQTQRGTLEQLAREPEWRGEITIVVAASGDDAAEAEVASAEPDEAAILARIESALAAGTPTKTIARELADWCGLPRRELYARVQAAREKAGAP